jgi:hypothetical protein
VSSGGLGEPKFNIDGSAFTGAWGRPQRDGPALRATSIITYANWLIKNGNTSYVTSKLWPMIQLDLNYVQNNYQNQGFDLWEEVNSMSFFTTAVQHRSLREGILLANTLGQTSVVSGWTTAANGALCLLQVRCPPISVRLREMLTAYLELLEPFRQLHHCEHGWRSLRQGLEHAAGLDPHVRPDRWLRRNDLPAVLGPCAVEPQGLRRLLPKHLPDQQRHRFDCCRRHWSLP